MKGRYGRRGGETKAFVPCQSSTMRPSVLCLTTSPIPPQQGTRQVMEGHQPRGRNEPEEAEEHHVEELEWGLMAGDEGGLMPGIPAALEGLSLGGFGLHLGLESVGFASSGTCLGAKEDPGGMSASGTTASGVMTPDMGSSAIRVGSLSSCSLQSAATADVVLDVTEVEAPPPAPTAPPPKAERDEGSPCIANRGVSPPVIIGSLPDPLLTP